MATPPPLTLAPFPPHLDCELVSTSWLMLRTGKKLDGSVPALRSGEPGGGVGVTGEGGSVCCGVSGSGMAGKMSARPGDWDGDAPAGFGDGGGMAGLNAAANGCGTGALCTTVRGLLSSSLGRAGLVFAALAVRKTEKRRRSAGSTRRRVETASPLPLPCKAPAAVPGPGRARRLNLHDSGFSALRRLEPSPHSQCDRSEAVKCEQPPSR